MLARNDMINEGSRTNPFTGARKLLLAVKDCRYFDQCRQWNQQLGARVLYMGSHEAVLMRSHGCRRLILKFGKW